MTVEGPNGVGKTSLVQVAGYQLEKETKARRKSSLVLIPDIFQFTSDESSLDFKRKVYAGIASHFIQHKEELRQRLDLQFDLNPLEAWLETPLHLNASVSVGGFGAGGGRAPNQTSGFDFHGFFYLLIGF